LLQRSCHAIKVTQVSRHCNRLGCMVEKKAFTGESY
jgi:hypothetical protein